MKESTRLALARLESIIAMNAGNRLTVELQRGMLASMTEVLVEALEQRPAAGLVSQTVTAPAAPMQAPDGAEVLGSGTAEVGSAG